MGMITCSIHGLSGFYEICKHLLKDFNNGIVPERRYLPVYDTQLCLDCYNEHNVQEIPDLTIEEALLLPEEDQVTLEDSIYTVYDAIKRRAICVKCFKQVQADDAKRTGKELSFEPFENTLMYKDKDIINDLKQKLIDNFHFDKIKNPGTGETESTWGIFGGDITQPLSIYFYYITQKEEQDKLLSFIEGFFESIVQKQRKVIFYESKNWIIEKHKNGISSSLGENKVLLEVLTK